MRTLKLSGLMALAILATGCASSVPVMPTLKVESNKPYVWDDSKSVALNVAHMALPSGVGGGMVDFTDGREANEGKPSTASKIADGILNFGVAGFGQVVGGQAIANKATQHLYWNPTIVDLVPVDLLHDAQGKLDFKTTQNYIGEKVRAVLQAQYPDLQWYGAFTPNKELLRGTNTLFLFYSEPVCKEAIKVATRTNTPPAHFEGFRFFHPQEDYSMVDKYCMYSGKLSVASTINHENVEKYVVTFEIETSVYFTQAIMENYDGYVINPKTHEAQGAGMTMVYPMAAVHKKGELFMFQKVAK